MLSMYKIFFIFCVSFCSLFTSVFAQNLECLNLSLHPLNSVSPNDTDFSDLEFLKNILKDVYIVALGEEEHGAGTSFEAKTRLVKFLHQEMGFEVLAFESGLYDCHKAWQLIEQGNNADSTAGKGVFGVWSLSKQMQPMFEYFETVKNSDSPLILSGFDFQFSGSQKGFVAEEYLIKDLKALLSKYNIGLVDNPEWIFFENDLQGRIDYTSEEGDLAMNYLVKIENELINLDKNRELEFWLQWIKSTKALISDRKFRDKYMAENLIWLKENFYPDKKFILWGASAHFMYNQSELRYKKYKDYPPMGSYLRERYGNRLYTIAATAYEGERAWVYEELPRELYPATKGSLEYILNKECDEESCFLDFREMDMDCFLQRKKIKARPYGWTERMSIYKHMDALIFHKKMGRSIGID